MKFLLFFGLVFFSLSYNNGVGKLPAMGWNSWNQFGCNIDENLIIQTMDGLKKAGLDKYGWNYINLDDCWQLEERDEKGIVVTDPEKFPKGIKYLADEAHKRGLKLGIYTDIGNYTCQKRAGSYGHYKIDAETYKKFEIDYLKVDFCYTEKEVKEKPWIYYSQFSKELNNTGRPILLSLCNWGVKNPWEWAGEISNSWRTTGDISSNFESVLKITKLNQPLYKYSNLYQYNDPDMLEIGVIRDTSLTDLENKAHFSLWCFMNSPLILGVDLRNISSNILEIITNEEIIQINQDEKGKQGLIVKEDKLHVVKDVCIPAIHSKCKHIQIWKKELVNNKIALMIFNHASAHKSHSSSFNEKETIVVKWEDIGFKKGKKFNVRDCWNHKELGIFDNSFQSLPLSQHEVQVLIFSEI